MAGKNPYAAPKADLATPDSGEIDTSSPYSIKGRFARSTYLAYTFGFTVLLWFIFGAIVGLGAVAGDGSKGPGTLSGIVIAIAYVVMIVFSVIFGVRRLHDLNWSGWWMAVMFIPLVNVVLAIPMLFFKGTPGVNKYGPPRPPKTVHVVLAWVLGFIPILGIVAAIAIPAYQDYVKRAKAQSVAPPPAIQQPQGARP